MLCNCVDCLTGPVVGIDEADEGQEDVNVGDEEKIKDKGGYTAQSERRVSPTKITPTAEVGPDSGGSKALDGLLEFPTYLVQELDTGWLFISLFVCMYNCIGVSQRIFCNHTVACFCPTGPQDPWPNQFQMTEITF